MIRFSVFSVLPILACGVGYEQDAVTEDIEIGVTEQALDAARTRMIQEASQAMTGSWWTYNETNWPTATTYGTYSYVSSDLGAWNLLLDKNYNGGVRGWWVSCRRNSTTYNYNTTDAPCLFTAYGDLNTASLYDCQGICSSEIQHKGGQCKPFTNLVAYRSGIYQNPGYAFKKLPDDLTIAASSPTGSAMPTATYANIEPGDLLRRPYGHAVIVVRKASSSQVVVLDSNWTGGNGAEKISTHSMSFGSGDTNSNLGAYRVLKCVYDGGC